MGFIFSKIWKIQKLQLKAAAAGISPGAASRDAEKGTEGKELAHRASSHPQGAADAVP